MNEIKEIPEKQNVVKLKPVKPQIDPGEQPEVQISKAVPVLIQAPIKPQQKQQY